MTNLPNAGAPTLGSPSSVDDLENVLARLSITREGAREIIRALVTLAATVPGDGLDLASSNSVTVASPDSTVATSSTVITGTEAFNTGDGNAVDNDQLSDTSAASEISFSELGDSGFLSPASSATLVAATPLNVASSPQVITAAPGAIALLLIAASTTNAIGVQTAVTTGATPTAAVGGAVVTAAAAPAVPLYNILPVNAPANAILPPAHLLTVPFGYHVPATNAEGPFYVITRSRNIGVFNGWETTSPLVTGVSHAVFSRVASMVEGHARMNMAITSAFALYLT